MRRALRTIGIVGCFSVSILMVNGNGNLVYNTSSTSTKEESVLCLIPCETKNYSIKLNYICNYKNNTLILSNNTCCIDASQAFVPSEGISAYLTSTNIEYHCRSPTYLSIR